MLIKADVMIAVSYTPIFLIRSAAYRQPIQRCEIIHLQSDMAHRILKGPALISMFRSKAFRSIFNVKYIEAKN